MLDKKTKKYHKTKLESYLTGVLFCVIFFSGFLVCQKAMAADYYASPTGGASKLGTKADPYLYTNVPWTTLDDETSTLYLVGGSYTTAKFSITHNTTANTLTIKPCSASPNPTGCDSRVIFSAAMSITTIK